MSIENEEELENLMYDPELKKTRTYFKVLQILRIFSDSIEAEEVAFGSFAGSRPLHGYVGPGDQILQDEGLVIDHNWGTLKALHQEKTKKLLFKISVMKKEIESLRDGVSQPFQSEEKCANLS